MQSAQSSADLTVFVPSNRNFEKMEDEYYSSFLDTMLSQDTYASDTDLQDIDDNFISNLTISTSQNEFGILADSASGNNENELLFSELFNIAGIDDNDQYEPDLETFINEISNDTNSYLMHSETDPFFNQSYLDFYPNGYQNNIYENMSILSEINESESCAPQDKNSAVLDTNSSNNTKNENIIQSHNQSLMNFQRRRLLYDNPSYQKNCTKSLLFTKSNITNEEKKFKCTFDGCNKSYSKLNHLKAHIRRHSGAKPFICNWTGCRWRFARSDELGRHRRSHLGIKPHQCTYCTKSFSRSDHLNKHLKVHLKKLKLDKN